MLTIALALTAFATATDSRPAEPIPVLIVSGANNHDWHWTAPELEKTSRQVFVKATPGLIVEPSGMVTSLTN